MEEARRLRARALAGRASRSGGVGGNEGGQGSGRGGSGGNGSRFSEHPADRLIREIIRTGRGATGQERSLILRRMRVVPFPAVGTHLRRRLAEQQWAEQMTEGEYLADLRRAIQDLAARLVVYARRGGNLSAVLAETSRVVPGDHRGQNALPLTFVVYSADRGILLTGYQASVVSEIAIPEAAQWLK